MKYPISKEFFPFSLMTPPIRDARIAGWMGSKMKPPRWVSKDRDKEVSIEKEQIKAFDGNELSLYIFKPRGLRTPSPCLVYYHGGGFFFEGAGYHYKLAKQYAMECRCIVVFVQYRLAPKHPHPIPSEDCYSALQWTFENSKALNIDKNRIGVGGDSAGGALAAAVCQMARDRGSSLPILQLLVYPVTDRRMKYDSCQRFTDTPMWNALLSKKMWDGYIKSGIASEIAYASPMEAKSFEGLPCAYVETAEYDCLHDEGIAYALALRNAGVEVTVNETSGTMHGFDIVENAPTTMAAINARIDFINRIFSQRDQ